MAAMSVTELKEERRRAFEELSGSLEAINIKSLIEFRGQVEVPRPVESVAVATVCMVARVDDTVEVGVDGLPARTWDAVQANMARPGHFVNSLRQFPYAVDSGRMPEVNVFAARQCLENVSPEHLENDPVAARLYSWILAAWRYTEVVQMLRLSSSVSGPQLAAPAAPVAYRPPDSPSKSTPPTSPENDRLSARNNAPLEVSADTPGKPMRSSIGSMGSSVAGSNSVFGRSPIPDPSPGGQSTRSSRPSGGTVTGQAGAGGRGVAARRPGAGGYAPRQSRESTGNSTLRVTPSGSPASTRSPISRASPSHPSSLPRRRPGTSGGSSVGYPRGTRSKVGIEDWQQKLEQMRREAREMKAMEAQLKWNMKRSEDKQRKNEAKEDIMETMKWRQDRKKGLDEYAANRALQEKQVHLKESQEFQEFKRAVHQVAKEDELQNIKEEYLEIKEVSEWNIHLRKTLPEEERRAIEDANLENYALLSEYHMEAMQQERMEQKFAREEAEELSLGYEFMQAQRERDEALQSLEFFRMQQRLGPAHDQDIPTRPFSTGNSPL